MDETLIRAPIAANDPFQLRMIKLAVNQAGSTGLPPTSRRARAAHSVVGRREGSELRAEGARRPAQADGATRVRKLRPQQEQTLISAVASTPPRRRVSSRHSTASERFAHGSEGSLRFASLERHLFERHREWLDTAGLRRRSQISRNSQPSCRAHVGTADCSGGVCVFTTTVTNSMPSPCRTVSKRRFNAAAPIRFAVRTAPTASGRPSISRWYDAPYP